jgi:pyridoxal phosphate enzyme (YggS family)
MLSIPQISPHSTRLGAALAALRRRIGAAAEAAGRNVDDITVLAASKGHPAEAIAAARALGLHDFGENYVDEAVAKIAALGPGDGALRWHFIGRLQANKTRLVATHFDWVHGVDRLKIAERLSAQRGHWQTPLNVCLQVNVAAEGRKAGVSPQALPELVGAVSQLPRLKLRGLMCMLPYGAAAAEQSGGFASLRRLLESANRAGATLDTLSMGMSADLEAAVQEGATLVRIGTDLFGPRVAPPSPSHIQSR